MEMNVNVVNGALAAGKFIERIRWDEYGNVTNHFIP
jgi:hypothetical protein